MRSRLSIIAICLSFCLACASASEKPDWQAELEAELQQLSARGTPVPEVQESRGHLYVTVSTRVGRILDSHTKDELLPYLMELRRASPAGSSRIPLLQEWYAVVSSGARGTPADSVYHYVVP